jgi:hypothetical protein
MTNTNRRRFIFSLLVLIILLGVAAYLHMRSPFNGTWWRVQGAGYPEMTGTNEMTVRLVRDQFALRFFKTEGMEEGLERITYLLDDREHPFRVLVDGSKEMYRAKLDGSTVVITHHFEDSNGTPLDWGAGKETWSLSESGHKLTWDVEGKEMSNETVFRRVPFLRSVLLKTP